MQPMSCSPSSPDSGQIPNINSMNSSWNGLRDEIISTRDMLNPAYANGRSSYSNQYLHSSQSGGRRDASKNAKETQRPTRSIQGWTPPASSGAPLAAVTAMSARSTHVYPINAAPINPYAPHHPYPDRMYSQSQTYPHYYTNRNLHSNSNVAYNHLGIGQQHTTHTAAWTSGVGVNEGPFLHQGAVGQNSSLYTSIPPSTPQTPTIPAPSNSSYPLPPRLHIQQHPQPYPPYSHYQYHCQPAYATTPNFVATQLQHGQQWRHYGTFDPSLPPRTNASSSSLANALGSSVPESAHTQQASVYKTSSASNLFAPSFHTASTLAPPVPPSLPNPSITLTPTQNRPNFYAAPPNLVNLLYSAILRMLVSLRTTSPSLHHDPHADSPMSPDHHLYFKTEEEKRNLLPPIHPFLSSTGATALSNPSQGAKEEVLPAWGVMVLIPSSTKRGTYRAVSRDELLQILEELTRALDQANARRDLRAQECRGEQNSLCASIPGLPCHPYHHQRQQSEFTSMSSSSSNHRGDQSPDDMVKVKQEEISASIPPKKSPIKTVTVRIKKEEDDCCLSSSTSLPPAPSGNGHNSGARSSAILPNGRHVFMQEPAVSVSMAMAAPVPSKPLPSIHSLTDRLVQPEHKPAIPVEELVNPMKLATPTLPEEETKELCNAVEPPLATVVSKSRGKKRQRPLRDIGNIDDEDQLDGAGTLSTDRRNANNNSTRSGRTSKRPRLAAAVGSDMSPVPDVEDMDSEEVDSQKSRVRSPTEADLKHLARDVLRALGKGSDPEVKAEACASADEVDAEGETDEDMEGASGVRPAL
ncbi:hypothetical protein VKT23_013378 [Stygiomarasmius scandens]|uniref:Uncharacterized protein n=1 Tax=Marasmiellus scandens TaxID=2682957 RepID=A0ABR1J374_9AGAR